MVPKLGVCAILKLFLGILFLGIIHDFKLCSTAIFNLLETINTN